MCGTHREVMKAFAATRLLEKVYFHLILMTVIWVLNVFPSVENSVEKASRDPPWPDGLPPWPIGCNSFTCSKVLGGPT